MNLLLSPLALRTPELREAVLPLGRPPEPPEPQISRRAFEALVAS